MSNDNFARLLRRWALRVRRPADTTARRLRARPQLVEIEDRTAPAVLPAPELLTNNFVTGMQRIDPVGGSQPVDFGSAGSAAAHHPLDFNKQVVIGTRLTDGVTTVVGAFTANGGLSWTQFYTAARVVDPNTDPTAALNAQLFPSASGVTVTIGRDGRGYIAHTQHAADVNAGGALIVDTFDFSGNFASTAGSTRNIIYRWRNGDPAFNPYIAIDTNAALFNDPAGGTQVDPLSDKAAYVAWNTNATAPTGFVNPGKNFNPNAILVAASNDRGVNWSSPFLVNDGGYFTATTNGGAGPVMAFSGGSTPIPGQLTFAWNRTQLPQGTKTAAIVIDRSQPAGDPTTPVAPVVTQTFSNAGVVAIPDGGTKDIPIVVNITDTNFDTVTDIDVSLSMIHPNLNHVSIQLVPPAGSELPTFTLLRNRTLADGTDVAAPNPITFDNYHQGLSGGPGLGVNKVGDNFQIARLTFDDQAPRRVNDPGNAGGLIGSFRPETGNLTTTFFGAARDKVNGTWTLKISDIKADGTTPPPNQSFRFGSITITARMENDGLGGDSVVVAPGNALFAGALQAGVNNVHPFVLPASPNGIGPGVTIAVDNTAGFFSPTRGTMYIAYTSPIDTDGDNKYDDTDIALLRSTNGGLSFGLPTRLNQDTAFDNFTEGNRPQFAPTLAVDQRTGTLVASFLDARLDASDTRVSTTVLTSIDAGNSFSEAVAVNRPKVGINAITGAVQYIEPVPTNITTAPGGQVGYRMSLLADAGRINSVFTGNLNSDGTSVFVSRLRTAAGPRIIGGDQGPVVNDASSLANGQYNNSFAADGTRRLDGFTITFDRPVDPASFTPGDVTVLYRDPNVATAPAVPVQVQAVEASFDNTTFFVRFTTPQTRVGTYSYAVGPDIRDFVRNSNPNAAQELFPLAPLPPFTSTTTPVPIADAGTTNNTITVAGFPAGQTVAGVRVALNIQHPNVSDLRVSLIGPGGTRVLLFDRRGGDTDNLVVTFDDLQGGSPIASAPSPFAVGGVFRPESPLSLFNNTAGNGVYTLEIVDAAGGNVGTLASWTLTLTPGVLRAPLGNRMDQDADAVPAEGGSDDTFTVPGLAAGNGTLFQAPFNTDTLPLIIPGPHLQPEVFNGAAIPGKAQSFDNLVLNAGADSIDLTFDRNIYVNPNDPNDPNGFSAADIIRMTGPYGPYTGTFQVIPLDKAGGSPQTAPAPTKFFRVRFSQPQVFSGQYSIEVGSNIRAANALGQPGELLDTNLNAGVEQLFGESVGLNGIASNDNTTTRSYSTSLVSNLTIPAGGTVSLPLFVPDSFVISPSTDKRTQVRINIRYPFTRDLDADLVAPDGTRVRLFTGVGNRGTPPFANFSNTTFDDAATTPIQFGVPPFDIGAFNPQRPLADLNGKQAQGTWRIEVINRGTSTGVFDNWSLTLPQSATGSGLGEAVADRFTVGFRVFTQDPSNPLSRQTWTPVGPSPTNGQNNSSRITALAVDPSDRSGNTMFLGGASGGIWKTTNFLTTDPAGPVWEPLTDFGPTFAINSGGLAVFPRNNDPNQSIVFALTGEGDTSSPGVGVLRSLDGGRTWKVLDSAVNADAAGNILPINATQRDRVFFAATGFKILVDPRPTPNGEVIVYMAISGNAAQAGVWRSNDTGRTWFRIRAGQATDIAFAEGSNGANGNLEILYAGFRGEGVFITNQAPTAAVMVPLTGGNGNALLRDLATGDTNGVEVTVNAPADTPNGAKGRVVLATPALTDSPLRNSFYSGYLYALVATPDSKTDGLYLTKDFGRNWTRVQLPRFDPPVAIGIGPGFPSNDESLVDHQVAPIQANYDLAMVVDPTNPNIVIISGLGSFNGNLVPAPTGGTVRVDVSNMSDPYSFVLYDNSDPGAGTVKQLDSAGPAIRRDAIDKFGTPGLLDPAFLPFAAVLRSVNNAGVTEPANFFNLLRDPAQPFLTNSTLLAQNVVSLQNDGGDAKYQPFLEILTGDNPQAADTHRIITFIDPITKRPRYVFGVDHGVFTGVDRGDGTLTNGTGFAQFGRISRNGNLQLAQFYSGAVQPSQLAADLAGALFYGLAQDNGFPVSSPNVLQTGDTNWAGAQGDGSGIVVDQTGSGTAYEYRWPCCTGGSGLATDFFQVLLPQTDHSLGGVSRTFGLLQAGDNPGNEQGQWLSGGSFGYPAVNPINGNALVMSSAVGRLFMTTNKGVVWFPIAEPTQLDSTVARAVAFGAPNPATPGQLDSFIYAGTEGGRIFVTTTGSAPFTDISAGLDGTPVRQIVTNPRRGSREAYAVTRDNVYFMADSTAPGASWRNITANLFQLRKATFGDAGEQTITLDYLETIAADWRFAIPVNPNNPNGATFPVLYVGGEGGVFRSMDQGRTWNYFPAASSYTGPDGTVYTVPDGGFLPNVHVTDLDLATGDIDPATGLPRQNSGGLNLLVASTYGRGSWAIRLDPNLPANSFQSGPRVVRLDNPNPANGPSNALDITFNGPVDPNSFTATDVTLLGPDGTPIAVTGVAAVPNPGSNGQDQRNRFRISFAQQTAPAFFTLTIGPGVTDFSGFAMNQNGNAINGEPTDAETRRVFLNGTTAGTLFLTGLPAQVVAGTPAAFTLTATDALGNVITGYTGTVRFTSNDPRAVLPPDTTFLPGDNGTRTFAVEFRSAGPRTVTATDLGNGAINGTGGTTVVGAGAASFTVDGLPGSVVASAGNNTPFTVTARDAFGNVASGYTGTVRFSSDDPQAVLPADATLVNGVGTFSASLRSAGVRSIGATDTANGAVLGAGATTVLNTAASRFDIGGLPSAATAGASTAFTVTARDEFGNRVNGFTGTVTFASTTDQLATLPASYTFTGGENGQQTFAVTFRTAGPQTVTVTSGTPGVAGATAGTTVRGAAATLLQVSALPNPLPAGSPAAFTVTARDQFGNVADGYSGTVAFSSTDPRATLPPTAVLSNGSGTFNVVLRTAGPQSVTAVDTANGALVGTSTTTVRPAAATQLFVSGPSGPVAAGAQAAFTVSALDAFGNPDSGFTGTLALTSTDPQATLPASVTLTNGTATVPAVFRTAGAQTLTATDVSNGAITGFLDTAVVAGEAASFTIGGLPDPLSNGAAADFTVTARDAFGNPADGFNGAVRFTSTDPQAVLPADAALTNGVGTFALRLRTAGPQTVAVASTANPGVTGSAVTNVRATAATRFAVSGLSGQVTAGFATPFTVTAVDDAGNPVTNYTGPVRFASSDPQAGLPPPAALVNGTGTFTVTLRTLGDQTLSVADVADASLAGSTGTLSVVPVRPPTPAQLGTKEFAVGAGSGSSPAARFFNPDGSERYTTPAFDPALNGGVRVAAGDFNGDGVADLVVGTGPGSATQVRVVDGVTQRELFSLAPFEAAFTGGVYVSAGDLTGDGVADLVISPDRGGGPRVQVYNGAGFGKLADFFGIEDPNFRGGARTAVSDVNGDDIGDLVVAAGFGGGPRVAAFRGETVRTGQTPQRAFGDRFVFEQGLRNGVFVTGGDLDGDRFADVIVGGGPGGGPRVFALSGKALSLNNQEVPLANFFGGDTGNRGGIRVTAKDLDGDTRSDIVVGAGDGAGSRVTAYLGKDLATGTVNPFFDFEAFPGFGGGVFVG